MTGKGGKKHPPLNPPPATLSGCPTHYRGLVWLFSKINDCNGDDVCPINKIKIIRYALPSMHPIVPNYSVLSFEQCHHTPDGIYLFYAIIPKQKARLKRSKAIHITMFNDEYLQAKIKASQAGLSFSDLLSSCHFISTDGKSKTKKTRCKTALTDCTHWQ